MHTLSQALLWAKPLSHLSAIDGTCTIQDLKSVPPFDTLTGLCVNVDTCLGFATPGFCPGAASIQCCTETFAPSSGSSTQALSPFGSSVIEGFEGWSPNFYCDGTHKAPAIPTSPPSCAPSEGWLTIGYGHKCGPECNTMSTPLSRADGDALMQSDLVTFVGCVSNDISASTTLTQNQFDALVSFAYNAGCGPLGTVADSLNANDFDGAIASMKNVVHDKNGNVVRELVRRRAIEVNIFNS